MTIQELNKMELGNYPILVNQEEYILKIENFEVDPTFIFKSISLKRGNLFFVVISSNDEIKLFHTHGKLNFFCEINPENFTLIKQ